MTACHHLDKDRQRTINSRGDAVETYASSNVFAEKEEEVFPTRKSAREKQQLQDRKKKNGERIIYCASRDNNISNVLMQFKAFGIFLLLMISC